MQSVRTNPSSIEYNNRKQENQVYGQLKGLKDLIRDQCKNPKYLERLEKIKVEGGMNTKQLQEFEYLKVQYRNF